jgi:hypothetical protein
VARNGVDQAACFLLGLGDGAHVARLTLSPDNAGDFRIDSSEAGLTVDALVLPLDDAVPPLGPIGFLKLDTQGSEVKILRGARAVLARSKGQFSAIIEYWPYGLASCGSSHHELAEAIAELSGYLFQIDAVNQRLVPRSVHDLHALGDAGVFSVEAGGHTNLLLIPAPKLEAVRRYVDASTLPTDASVGLDSSSAIVTFPAAAQQLSALASCERRLSSQNGEDGVIAEMVRRLAPRPFAVEIGVGDGTECNTRRLRESGWDVIMIDADPRGADGIAQAFVTAENVNDLLAARQVPDDLGLLSVDVDGNDLWLLLALDARYRPAIIVTEYNATLGPSNSLSVPYRPRRVWDGTNHFGASLGAFAIVARGKGYSLVYCESVGVNAFFVRSDLLASGGLVEVGVTEAYRPPRYGGMDDVGRYLGHRSSGQRMWRIDSHADALRRYRASRCAPPLGWWRRLRHELEDRSIESDRRRSRSPADPAPCRKLTS